ncbi:MAG: glycosyltransferase [Candidatus Nanohaloarchaea archaeon]|nr:glycosyltransferase [Candidatus Nanohaloarchaea archaeon]
MSEELEASVVVPAYGEEEWIGDTLSSLEGQGSEIIVVAGGEDRTLEVAEEHPAADTVVEDTVQKGWGAAVNQGVEDASGDVVAITDADVIVPEDWVRRHLERYEDGVVGVGGPALAREDGIHGRTVNFYGLYVLPVLWRFGLKLKMGNNSSYRRDELLEAGGFDEDLDFLEDVDMAFRMDKRGNVVYDRSLQVKGSVRRLQDEGHLSMVSEHLKGYWSHFVRGRGVDADYH